MTTYGLFSVDFAVNSLKTYGANKKSVSVKDFREGEKMKFVVHDVFSGDKSYDFRCNDSYKDDIAR